MLKEGGQSKPIVRSRLQEIYSPIPSQSEDELKLKAPVYNDKGRLADFSSRNYVYFTLRSLVNSYNDGDDLPEGNYSIDSSKNELLTSKLKQPFYDKSTCNMITRSKLSSNNNK